jgi:hypothetical protein
MALHTERTFEMEENIGLVVLEHLSHQLRVHVLDVDLLQILVEHHDCLIQFLLGACELGASGC